MIVPFAVLALVVSVSNAQGQAGVVPLSQGPVVPGAGSPAPVVPSPAAIRVAFKLDPRLTTGLYMGERWVSPPTHSAFQVGTSVTVDARASGVDAKGKPARISARWTTADPRMVTFTRGEGNDVKITIQRAGESVIDVTSHGVSKQLAVKAVRQGEVMRVEIAQK
jgi:hypothetical protein